MLGRWLIPPPGPAWARGGAIVTGRCGGLGGGGAALCPVLVVLLVVDGQLLHGAEHQVAELVALGRHLHSDRGGREREAGLSG